MDTDAHLERLHKDITRKIIGQPARRFFRGGAKDQTPVPGNLIPRLARLASDLGYPVSTTPCINGNDGILGMTSHSRSWQRSYIRLRDDMTPASLARTLCHELGHVLSHRDGNVPTFAEEFLAESVAFMVTSALGCTDGQFSSEYLAGHAQGRPETFTGITEGHVRRFARLILDNVA
jgi:hypothetical protein